MHFPIHRVEPGIQYSPEIINITDTNILLDDYQNMNGKSVHVSNIFDRKSSTFHLIRDEAIKSVKIIKAFSRNRQIFWNILDYNVNTKSIKLEVRVSPSIKRNFTIKL